MVMTSYDVIWHHRMFGCAEPPISAQHSAQFTCILLRPYCLDYWIECNWLLLNTASLYVIEGIWLRGCFESRQALALTPKVLTCQTWPWCPRPWAETEGCRPRTCALRVCDITVIYKFSAEYKQPTTSSQCFTCLGLDYHLTWNVSPHYL